MKLILAAEIIMACGFLAFTQKGFSDSALENNPTPESWITNRPAVYIFDRLSGSTNPRPPKIFQHYLPDSFNNFVWTNFIAHTNGRDMTIWTVRTHSIDWPLHPPIVTWNSNSLMWGMKGITALSPCWQVESGIGQVAVTALTRRHAYARGHGMGPEGFNENFAGKKIWFVTTNNTVVEAKVLRDVVRTSKSDYTILLLSEDLPPAIEPLRVVSFTELYKKYSDSTGAPKPLFKTEQSGKVSAEVEGLKVNTWKGGDSGSPDMVPIPGELIFMGGRSTAAPSPDMQADMDQLSQSANLDPKKYQMQWLDLSGYPSY